MKGDEEEKTLDKLIKKIVELESEISQMKKNENIYDEEICYIKKKELFIKTKEYILEFLKYMKETKKERKEKDEEKDFERRDLNLEIEDEKKRKYSEIFNKAKKYVKEYAKKFKAYSNKWVALFKDKIVDNSEDLTALIERVFISHKSEEVCIEYIPNLRNLK